LSDESIEEDELGVYETITCADLAIHIVDDSDPQSRFLAGALRTAFVPLIPLTGNDSFSFHSTTPREYQPRIIVPGEPLSYKQTISEELSIFAEDFLDLENQEEVDKYARMLIEIGAAKGSYTSGIRDIFVQEFVMHDQYKVGQAGAVGPGAHAHDITFNQVWNESSGNIDIAQLARELTELRNSLSKEASKPEQYMALGEVAAAEKAAIEGNGAKALEHLKQAGSWVWDVATKIGVGVATAAAKTALGI
jgi:hypothetical protein